MSFAQSVGFVTVGKDLRTLLLFGVLGNEQRLRTRPDPQLPALRAASYRAPAARGAPRGCCGGLPAGGGSNAAAAAASPAAVVAAAAAVTWEPL